MFKQYKIKEINDNSERTPMKDHFPKDLKENLNTNEGMERVSIEEVKIEFSEIKEKEYEKDSQKTNKKKKTIYHDIKNFDKVIRHRNKFSFDNKNEENGIKINKF